MFKKHISKTEIKNQSSRSRTAGFRIYCIALVIAGALALSWQYKPFPVQSQQPEPKVEHIIPIVIEQSPLPTHIKIDSLIDQPIEEHSLSEDGMPTVSSEDASYFNESARPGDIGNMIIYGHNKKHIFGNLISVKVGDIIDITTANNTTVQYKVTEVVTVKTTETHWLDQTDTAVITVYTCTGFMDSLRLVVRGELITP